MSGKWEEVVETQAGGAVAPVGDQRRNEWSNS